MNRNQLERETGELFSGLWKPYDEKLFRESVALFEARIEAAGLPSTFFAGKRCLDAGCGGGRNAIAMAQMGAKSVIGVDIGKEGLEDARARAAGLANVDFKYSSILDMPFSEAQFDQVWCAGVLMITDDENVALDSLTRVLKPGGHLYLLVYATEGLRWPLVQLLRPIAGMLTQPTLERAIEAAGLAANKRRTFLDDLFCPKLDFYTWERLRGMLEKRGYQDIHRWGPETRMDHEHSLSEYRADLDSLHQIFRAGADKDVDGGAALFAEGAAAIRATIGAVDWFVAAATRGELTASEALDRVAGQGHHRVFAKRA